MDDNEYYSMMRRQYSHTIGITQKSSKNLKSAEKINSENSDSEKTEGTFSEWVKKYGHEDAEMFLERNEDL